MDQYKNVDQSQTSGAAMQRIAGRTPAKVLGNRPNGRTVFTSDDLANPKIGLNLAPHPLWPQNLNGHTQKRRTNIK